MSTGEVRQRGDRGSLGRSWHSDPQSFDARPAQPSRDLPRLSRPGAGRQGERLTPQFRELTAAFDAERARLSEGTPTRSILLVVVFDLVGSIKDFQNAINQIDGLEFLTQFSATRSDPDDDFHMTERETGRTDKQVQHSLYLVMSSAKATDELIRLFTLWQQDQRTCRSRTGMGSSRMPSSS